MNRMDRILTRLLTMAVLLHVLSIPAIAFTPGPTVIRECPKCKALVEQPTTASGNTFGARFWTDGKMQAPMLPDRPPFVKCPKCKALFWIDEAKKVSGKPGGDKAGKQTTPVAYELPTEADYYKTADTVKDKKKEKQLRIRGWHLANDRRRNAPSGKKAKLSKRAVANLNALYSLLPDSDPEARIMKAEISRELGRFDRALAILKHDFPSELTDVVSVIRSLAKKKDAAVQEITR